MLGEVNVKGKRISTLIYELYDHRSSLRQNQIQALDAWNRVMKIAVEQNATAALEALSQEDTTIQEDSLLIQLKHELKSG